jgi:hypothetical protein
MTSRAFRSAMARPPTARITAAIASCALPSTNHRRWPPAQGFSRWPVSEVGVSHPPKQRSVRPRTNLKSS